MSLSLPEAFRDILAGGPSRPYVEEDGVWTFLGEVRRIADAVTALLAENGVAPTAAIGLVARNRMPHVAALFGLLAEGRTVVMLHAYQAPERLTAEIAELKLAAVVADAADWPQLEAGGSLGIAVSAERAVTVQSGTNGGDVASRAGVAIEMLTSGTTGSPKRVPISYATLTAAVEDAVLATAQAGTGDTAAPFIQFYPLGNISGLFGLITCAVRGQPVVLLEKFSVEAWVRAVEAYRPSAFMSLPPAALRMVLDADVPRAALVSIPVLRCGSAPLDPGLQDEFERRYGIPILINYGATEFCGVIANWTLDDHRRFGTAKRGSVGRARPGIQLRVVDPQTGESLPSGDTGQLEVLAERIAPDWVRTTDRALIDAEGFVFLKGRADSVIIRGGFKIAPEAVAEVLRAHPAIRDAGVVARADDRLGEVPVAAVELLPDAPRPTEATLIDLVRRQLSPQAAPVAVRFVAQLPRTGSLKVDRAALTRLMAAS